MLLYRLEKALGKKTVAKAINNDVRALERIEKFAHEPRRKPALAKWVNERLAGLAK